MDNKQDRQFYWEVKDFMQKNPTPVPSTKPSLKDSIKFVLHENKPYKVSTFSPQTNAIDPTNQILAQHSKMQKGNAPSCAAYTKNGVSNPFTLKEAVTFPKTQSGMVVDDRVTTNIQSQPSISLPQMKRTSAQPNQTATQPPQPTAQQQPNQQTTQQQKAKSETAPTDLNSAMKQEKEKNAEQSTSNSSAPLGTPDLSVRPMSGSVLPPFSSLAKGMSTTIGSEFKYSTATRIS